MTWQGWANTAASPEARYRAMVSHYGTLIRKREVLELMPGHTWAEIEFAITEDRFPPPVRVPKAFGDRLWILREVQAMHGAFMARERLYELLAIRGDKYRVETGQKSPYRHAPQSRGDRRTGDYLHIIAEDRREAEQIDPGTELRGYRGEL